MNAGGAPQVEPDTDVLVCMPTYNEMESLPATLAALRSSVPTAHVLVIDDGSPDGTGAWAAQQAVTDDHVHVLQRAGKGGLGPAYLAGFAWALERGYDVICEMDADGSHLAADLPRLLQASSAGADLVIGSRWVPGGAIVNWPVIRQLISRGGSLYTRIMLGLPVRDATAGFRAFRRETLLAMDLGDVASSGYCFQIDMAWRVHGLGMSIVEVPITFVERAEGVSKMSRAIVMEALVRVTRWGLARRAGQVRRVLTRSA